MRKLAIFFGFFCAGIGFAMADSVNIQYKDGRSQVVPLEQSVQGIQTIYFNSGGSTQGRAFESLSLTGAHRIKAKHSGKCMDVAGVDRNNGANIHQWDCHDGGNQKWRFVDVGNGYYRLEALHSGRCADVADRGTVNGTNVIQYDCHGGDNQVWKPIRLEGGWYQIKSKLSGRCLDVAGVGIGNGTNIQQWECHYGDNQSWAIE